MRSKEIRRFECASGRPSSFLDKRLYLMSSACDLILQGLGRESHVYASDGSYLKEIQAP